MNAMFETLKLRFSGDNLEGLTPIQAEKKSKTLPTGRLIELRAELMTEAKAYRDELETAMRRDAAGYEGRLQRAVDHGQRQEDVQDDQRHQLEFVASWKARAGSLGLHVGHGMEFSAANVFEALNERIRVVTDELKLRFRVEGEPAELQALRAKFRIAKAAIWPLFERVKQARDKARVAGLAVGEADVMAAVAAHAEAERAAEAIKAEIRAVYGVE
jgi:hypothetical protein